MVEAVDRAGNSATSTAAVTLDTAPPSLTITSPANGATFSATPITVTGAATDDLPEVGSVTCNNAPAMLTGSDFSCEVGLADGSSTIAVGATDGARNVTRQSLAVSLSTLPVPPPNPIEITPSAMALVVDEPRQLALVDDYGRVIAGASWSVSDPTVVELSTSDTVVLTGKTVGEVTITATWQDFSAQARANVYAGLDLAQGTLRWSGQRAAGYSTISMVQAQPVENMPDIYSVEQDGSGDLIVRTLTSDGRQMWRKPRSPGGTASAGAMSVASATQSTGQVWLVNAVGDAFGGLLLQFEDENYYSQIIRLDGATGQESWRYHSPWWLDGAWALHFDGTIYVSETPDPNTYEIDFVALDGLTGTAKLRIPISRLGYSGPLLVGPRCPDGSPQRVGICGGARLHLD